MKRTPRLTQEKRTKFPTKAKKEILAWYRALKDNKPCRDCGKVFRFWCLDMDHVPQRGKKFMDVSKMIREGFSKERIMQEIALTDLCCKNCHATRTYKRRKGIKIDGEY